MCFFVMKWGNTMKKINIVRSNEDFNNIMKTGKLIKNNCYVIYYQENIQNNYRIGISVPKKVGKAIVRNKIKRQLKSIIDKNIELIKTYDYIIIARNVLLEKKYIEIEKELINLINKI